MEVVVAVVLGQIGEAVQPHLVGLRQGEAQILLQRRVHLGGGQHRGRTWSVLRADGGGDFRGQLPLLRPVPAVEQLKQVDVLRVLVGGAEELISDVDLHHCPTVHLVGEELVPVEPGQFFLRQGLPGVAPPAGEGTPHRQADEEGRRRKGGQQGSGPPGDHGDALLQAGLACGHGGGAAQQVGEGGLGGHQPDQRPAVGRPGGAVRVPKGPLVAGQLSVPLGQGGGEPHQGVVPVEGQGRPPQHRPDVVPVAAVGELMGQYMTQHRRVARRRGGQVHRRAGEAVQAGGGQPPGHIHRHGQPRNWVGPPHPPQAEVEPQVGDHQRGGHGRRTHQPHGGEHRPPGKGLRRGGRLAGSPLSLRLRRGDGLDGLRRLRRLGGLCLPAPAAVLRGGSGDGALAHLHPGLG